MKLMRAIYVVRAKRVFVDGLERSVKLVFRHVLSPEACSVTINWINFSKVTYVTVQYIRYRPTSL
jgi:hypothetical protein